MTSYALSVTVSDSRPLADYYSSLIERQTSNLKREVADYFDSQSDLADGDEIDVKIELSQPDVFLLGGIKLERIQFDVYISGIFGGQSFEYYKRIKQPSLFATAREKRKKKGTRPTPEEDEAHERLFAHLAEKAFDGFEKAIGRSESFVAIRWRAFKIVMLIVSLLTAVGLLWGVYGTSILERSSTGFGRFMRFGAFAIGFLVYFVGYVIGAACMPLEFFEDHREGHRVMDFVNKDDPAAARFALRVGVVVLAAIAIFMTIVIRSTFGY